MGAVSALCHRTLRSSICFPWALLLFPSKRGGDPWSLGSRLCAPTSTGVGSVWSGTLLMLMALAILVTTRLITVLLTLLTRRISLLLCEHHFSKPVHSCICGLSWRSPLEAPDGFI